LEQNVVESRKQSEAAKLANAVFKNKLIKTHED